MKNIKEKINKKVKEKKTYTAYIICRNCGYGCPSLVMKGGKKIEISKGKKVKNIKCPNCGCRELYNSKPT